MGQKEVYDFIKNNPNCTTKDLSKELGQTEETLRVYITKLFKNGAIIKERSYLGNRRHPIWIFRIKE